MKIRADTLLQLKSCYSHLRSRRSGNWAMWRELAKTYLPYTHPWLLDGNKSEKFELNPNYLSSVGLLALRTQTAGLMNGITSPTRPWFKLGVDGDMKKLSMRSRQALARSEQVMYDVLARSNFYNTTALTFFDIGLMNIGAMASYKDPKTLLRFQRFNTGEFYVQYDYRDRLWRYAREIKLTLTQAVKEYGIENVPPSWAADYKNPASANSMKTIFHFAERNDGNMPVSHPADRFAWREFYWTQENTETDNVLRISGFAEQNATFSRWSGELELGAAPAMDALADMRELHQILLQKGIGLEKMVDPPMLLDASLRNQPKSTLPGGHTYIPNLQAATGARPVYNLQLPIAELRADIMELKQSIREIFHNDLFKMISQLDTVRSATEIDARKEEKLVMLAHFLERHEEEHLDPTITRVFNACLEADLFPEFPQELFGGEIKINYISILSTAQRAISTAPLERLLALVGQVHAVYPQVLDLVNFDELVVSYGMDIGANPTVLRDADELRTQRAAREAQLAQVEATATAATAIQGAAQLSQVDVGGGANALQRLLA